MKTEQIFSRFLLLSGLEAQEALRYRPFCEEAGRALSARLRPEAQGADERLAAAAAAMAFYQYALLQSSQNNAASFSAGDIRVTKDEKGALAAAAVLREQAIAAAAPLLQDEGFAFRRA